MKKLVSQLFLIFVSILLVSACSKSENVSEQKKLDPLEIIITPEIQKQTKNEVVKYQDIGKTLMIPGRLETQNRKLSKIV